MSSNFDEMAGRGDLKGGMDAERNAQIAALKKQFYSVPQPSDEVPEGETSVGSEVSGSESPADAQETGLSMLGVLKDAPLCRWEMCMLPGYNQVLNVWQPMYTHMFESLMAQPEPRYYVHLQTPGGTKNLMNPDFSLKVGSKAPMVGVLMRIVDAERREDSRLAIVVQGLGRVRVLEETQKEPYARASVQLLPDDEIIASYYSKAKELIQGDEGPAEVKGLEGWIHTISQAAAVASEEGWREFEVDSSSLGSEGAGVSVLCPLSTQDGIQQKISAEVRGQESKVLADAVALVLIPQNPNITTPVPAHPALNFEPYACVVQNAEVHATSTNP